MHGLRRDQYEGDWPRWRFGALRFGCRNAPLEARRALVESGIGTAAGCLAPLCGPADLDGNFLLADDRWRDAVFRDGTQVPSEKARIGVA